MNRRNRAEYARALSTLKRWDRESRPEDWTAREWSGLIAQASAQKPAAQEPISATAALIVLVWAALFLMKTRPADLAARNSARTEDIAMPAAEDVRTLSETVATEPDLRAASAESRSAAASEARVLLASAAGTRRPNGDKPAFTWISPDTGLQIVWFTNNNLKLEDRQ
jgi:hypothetical protein